MIFCALDSILLIYYISVYITSILLIHSYYNNIIKTPNRKENWMKTLECKLWKSSMNNDWQQQNYEMEVI